MVDERRAPADPGGRAASAGRRRLSPRRGGAVEGRYGAVAVRFIGLEDLIANKRAAGRPKDLADIEALEQR